MKILWNLLNYFVFLYPLYMSFIWTIGGLSFFLRRERKPYPALEEYPFFSILIPAHNEEKNIVDTVCNLAQLEYPRYEVVVIDDGSTDTTGITLDELVEKNSRWLKVVHLTPNSGKARALNAGLLFTEGELVLVMDADCFLGKDTLKALAWHFVNYPRVAAVTGNPRIINRTSLLGKVQVGEYSSIIGLIKRSQRILGKILTVSGVIAAFRKGALCECGLFDADTVTEDIDITWKLQKHFWEVRYEPRALCWILAPETLRGFWRQRVRWAQGGVEVIKKHFDVWYDWRQRRFWPVYVDYLGGVVWAFSLGLLVVSWMVSFILFNFGFIAVKPTQPFVPPAWTGAILALVCLVQFVVSLFIDYHYEDRRLLKYYFWVIWYPFFYWVISALAVFAGTFNVFIGKEGVSVKWESPDRGFHTLKSSTNRS
ncbi:MAG: poly-beta-1,6-N-acetyl-D-glucosamine synthase [Candidatus Omnitrophota bacterium]